MHSAPSTLMSGWIQEERTVGKDWKGPLPELCATWRPRRPSSVRAAQKEGIPTTTRLSKAPGLSRAAAEGGGAAGLLRPRREEPLGRLGMRAGRRRTSDRREVLRQKRGQTLRNAVTDRALWGTGGRRV